MSKGQSKNKKMQNFLTANLNNMTQKLWNTAKAFTRGKFIALNTHTNEKRK